MELIIHTYNHRPSRFYVDSRRVCETDFHFAMISARVAGRQLSAFLTRRRKGKSGEHHVVHYVSIN
ncbi:hypothetical protein [Hyphomicrobium sp.]|jgi:hypothetical protein|uniref:hypothetical protein n=1 Tax=Hyphomicrobium sp. TaxID=82 RepID=UPI003568055C